MTRYLSLALLLAPAAVAAQATDSTTPAPAAVAVAPIPRASWLSDRQPLRVGDLVTIVVDENTRASENVSLVGQSKRSSSMDLNPNGVEGVRLGPVKGFGTGFGATSNDGGQAVRSGDLTAVLSARVVAIDAAGNARIQGGKTVNVDGRLQQVSIEGYVRPDDVTSDNLVSSARIAEATILYKGKKIGPRQGILGKILSILWP
jgi:flagellar L-ring protein precursor FlgH